MKSLVNWCYEQQTLKTHFQIFFNLSLKTKKSKSDAFRSWHVHLLLYHFVSQDPLRS